MQMVVLGEQLAKNGKTRMKTKNSHEVLKAKMDEIKGKAYNEEMSKGTTKEEAQKQLNEAILKNRRATFALANANANNEYCNSQGMKKLNDQITEKETNTAMLKLKIEQNNVLSKVQEKMQEATLAHNINSQFVSDDLSTVEQVSYLLNIQVNSKLKEINEKHKFILQINELSAFIEQNSKLSDL